MDLTIIFSEAAILSMINYSLQSANPPIDLKMASLNATKVAVTADGELMVKFSPPKTASKSRKAGSKTWQHTCAQCSKEFESNSPRSLTCSDECRTARLESKAAA